MACQGLADLALGVTSSQAARLSELSPGAWQRLTSLRLLPNCLVPWPAPGCLPEGWCRGLPTLRRLCLCGARWQLPQGLGLLSGLEELEVESLAGPLRPATCLARLTRLAIQGGEAQVRGWGW